MSSLSQFLLVELFERRNNLRHFRDGAHPQIPAATMSRASFCYDLRPHKAFVSEDQPPLARFRQHTAIRFVLLHKVLRPDAGVLFVGYEGDQNSSGKIL